MILNAKFIVVVVLLCFCLQITFARQLSTKGAKIQKRQVESSSSETSCPNPSPKDTDSTPKIQLLEKLMTPTEFKKEFGPDSLKTVRSEKVKEVGKFKSACKKDCPIPAYCCMNIPSSTPKIPEEDVKFFLYTNDKKTEPQQLNAFKDSPWKSVKLQQGTNMTIIICHDFMSDPKGGAGEALREAYFNYYDSIPGKDPRKKKMNIILVDWSSPARAWTKHGEKTLERVYFPPSYHLWSVGYYTSLLVHKLSSRGGIPLDQIHLIGHGFGAQIMGYAGKYLAFEPDLKVEHKVARITALDPAAPCFEKQSFSDKFCLDDPKSYLPISRDHDAKFVDVIHTNGALFGMLDRIGHVDFYPNSGKNQPGCCSSLCSHNRAVELMVSATLGKNEDYQAVKCADLGAVLEKACIGPTSKTVNVLGQEVDKETSKHGIYYLATLDKPPYSKL